MTDTVRMIEDLTDRALGRTTGPPVLSRPASRGALHRHLEAIAANADVDAMPEPVGSGRGIKRAVLKLAGFSLTRQGAVNRSLIGVVNGLVLEVDHLNAEIQQANRRSAAAIAAMEASTATGNQHQREVLNKLNARLGDVESTEHRSTQALDELRSRLDTISDTLGALMTRLDDDRVLVVQAVEEAADRAGEISDLSAELRREATSRTVMQRQIGVLRDELRRQSSGLDSQPPSVELDTIAAADVSEVYGRFEAFFRPAGTDLTRRFAAYVGDLAHLAGGRFGVLDIGTGRGDFLSLLAAAGVTARGIDANPAAVAEAVEKGLDVVHADAVSHLRSLPDESVGAVSAFHLVEHLDPDVLIRLVDEIVRVLVPGGVLILETPNPTNLVVGAASFYHDPTHRRPITADYLSFLLNDRGLVDVTTRYVNPLPEYEDTMPRLDKPGFRSLELLIDDVRWALKGPQEYAVIGHRPGTL